MVTACFQKTWSCGGQTVDLDIFIWNPFQFAILETQSYENLSEAPNWCLQPDLNPATGQQDSSDSDQDPHDYELVGHPATHDHDSEHSLPDYVSVENVSTEDYDDIGDDEEDCSEEDYDDVE